MRASDKKHDHVQNLLHNNHEYGAISSFLSFPLIDVVQRYTNSWDERVSFPTQVFEEKKGAGRSKSSSRIDYIMTSPLLATKCINAGMFNNEDTYYLSDHYPVYAEFKFE